MWTRSELKRNARNSLAGSYWLALLVTLVTAILTGSNHFLTVSAEQPWCPARHSFQRDPA
jgi:hypothetical protein